MALSQGSDSYRPSYMGHSGPPRPAPDAQKAMYEFRGNRGDGRVDIPRRGRFTFHKSPRQRPSNRPLLSTSRVVSPDPSFKGAQTGDKFRRTGHLPDSDQDEMGFSNSDGDMDQRLTKKARTGPLWSNPDPYTALPPVPEASKKKQDVVKLIRKSRVPPPGAGTKSTPPGQGEDFISLDMGDEEAPPANAPTGPKKQQHGAHPRLDKRKRDTQEDTDSFPPSATKGSYLPRNGNILRHWRNDQDEDMSTPWYRPPSTPDALAGVALHQEILDFYEWVRPQAFEHEIRTDVIHRLQRIFSRLEPGCELRPFGSFAAGLYLPTADMDLVLMTRGSRGSKFVPSTKSLLWSIHAMLKREYIAVPGSIQPIAKAKVPIIKFIDAVTGLKVDLSFNNDTGLTANNTFQIWKERYPAMPILVSVIKQYLLFRGLDDVAFGGLGGFSTICLVTSLIQHHIPDPIPNLGELLLHFFHLYGRVFNKRDIAIRLEPPGYVRKELYLPFQYNADNPNRLSIIDPNKADNNISGGTMQINLILRSFSRAYDELQTRMTEREGAGPSSKSLLLGLIGGNYDAYRLQRDRLRRLHSEWSGRSLRTFSP